MEAKNKKIIWISGRCGYGKTEFANSVIGAFDRTNKKTIKLSGKDFVDFLVEKIKSRTPIEEMVYHFQNYDLLVLDDIDYVLSGKPRTQREIKEVVKMIVSNNKTKVILVSQKRARKIRKLKFDSNCCEYVRLKVPSIDFKIKLVEEWMDKEKLAVPEDKIKEIADKSNNLFQLKGFFYQSSFKYL